MSTPNSMINICSGVRLDNRYLHSICFKSETDQRDFFAGKVVKTFSAYSYLRKTWPLQVEATMEQAKTWSYLFFRNGTGKYYYYFINQVEYKNDNTVTLQLELDVLQTYLFDFHLQECFVERQHTLTDVAGENTVPEGLELGDYYSYHAYNMEDIADMAIMVLSSIDVATAITNVEDVNDLYMSSSAVFNGVYSGLDVEAFTELEPLDGFISNLDEFGKTDAIVSLWMYPRKLLKVKDDSFNGMEIENGHDTVTGAKTIEATVAGYMNYSDKIFEGYTPKNKKLYTHPYNMLYVTNNQGDTAEYRFEKLFKNDKGAIPFNLYGAISPDAGVKLVPYRYNTSSGNGSYDDGITIANYPQCAFNSDTYKVWLAQNYNQQKVGKQNAVVAMLGGAVTTAAGIATGNIGAIGAGAMAVYGGLSQIQGQLAQKKDAEAQPPQAKGVHSHTVNVAAKRQTFTFYYKSIAAEYARQIDDFFTMYGYKINRVQTPVIDARPAFTYVKTIGCTISSVMCIEDVRKIESIFDNGVTFWKDGNRIADYSQNNTVK